MHFLEIGIFLYLCFHKFRCIFHNYKTIKGIWMGLYRDVDPDDLAYFPSFFTLHFFTIYCVCSITPKLFKIFE